MNVIDILNKDTIRNFIYDNNSKIKILLGSRRVGKTSALCLSTVRDMQENNECDVLFCCSYVGQKRYILQTIKEICSALDCEYELVNDKVIINDNTLYIKSINEIERGDARGLRLKHLKVDEPYFSRRAFDDLLSFFKLSTIWANNEEVSISIAGTTPLTKELCSSCYITRYIAKASEAYNESEIEEFKKYLDERTYKREILLEFDDEPFDLFF